MKNLFAVFLFALLSACATAQSKDSDRPDWVDGKTSAYPDSKYIVAVGDGSSRDDAVQNAKNKLASSFLQKVESQTTSEKKSELTENTSGQTTGEAYRNTRSAVQISTNIQLRGAEIVQYWQDPASGQNYALAVIDKLKIRNSYMMDLNRLREKLLSLHANFKTKPDQKTGRDILDQAKAYADLAREAAAIGTPLGVGDPISETEQQAILDKLNELKQSRAIALDLSGTGDAGEQEASDLKSLIANCIQDKGYSVAEGSAKPVVKFAGTYRVASKHLKVEGFNKFEFSVKATVVQGGHTDKIFLPKESSGREQDQAFDNIKGEMSDALCSAIVKTL